VTNVNALYAELKPSMEAVSAPLFDLSKRFLKQQADYLPHAAVMTAAGNFELVGAKGERDLTTAAEILPLLHGGLRAMAKQKSLDAIGIAESVSIGPAGQARTQAIKVLFEHVWGLTVALYVPESVEGILPIQALRGPHNQGYYFRATDRAPKAGEFKYLMQGIVELGGINLAFTVLTNDGQNATEKAALRVAVQKSDGAV
jgi:hypothetical protein